MTESRTIAAAATPPGVGGIAVIRVSGADAVNIVDRVFSGGASLKEAKSHTVHYGHVIGKDSEPVDEVLVTVMLAPKSYTGENVVEIGTHGGLVASKNVLRRLIEAGAYPAEPGEFTKRAFLNGRIDLAQAEAVIDIINSKTTLEQKNALSQVKGGLSDKINGIRDTLVGLAASMQVIIDYPDEDLEDVTPEDIIETAKTANKRISELLDSADNGKIIKDGIKTVIAGKPNVGKSSILNMLAKEERAIVTDIAGTTRDVIEESVNVGGVPLILADTAGIRETEDVIEKIGVERSLKSIENADLVMVVLDSSRVPGKDEIDLLNETKNRKRIILVNKCDIKNDDAQRAIEEITEGDYIEISAKNGDGADKLTERICRLYNLGELEKGECVVTNVRHIKALNEAKNALENAVSALENGIPTDIASIDINAAIGALGEITGAVASEDIVNAVFHNFCVGK